MAHIHFYWFSIQRCVCSLKNEFELNLAGYTLIGYAPIRGSRGKISWLDKLVKCLFKFMVVGLVQACTEENSVCRGSNCGINQLESLHNFLTQVFHQLVTRDRNFNRFLRTHNTRFVAQVFLLIDKHTKLSMHVRHVFQSLVAARQNFNGLIDAEGTN